MIRLAWTTDPHLNHAPTAEWERWLGEISRGSPQGLVITGDISEADDVCFQLRRLGEAFHGPIYFVLGNHDFYERSIASTRREVIDLCREIPSLHYLTDCGPVELVRGSYLVGEDGWGDAAWGDYERSPVRLNDFRLINDFREADPADWKALLLRYGREAAGRLAAKLAAIPDHAADVLIATHVPPFRESCWYEGRTTDDFWAPFFVCGAVGKLLSEFVSLRPGCRFRVLCGHTHHAGIAHIASNLIVHTGAAVYGKPALEGVLVVSGGGSRLVSASPETG